MQEKLKLLNELNCFTLDDLHDIRKALTESYHYLENAIKNVQILNDEIYYIFRQSEKLRNDNFVKIGVYSITKRNKESLIFHIVSDINYQFKEIINANWVLLYDYELEVNKPIKINRFIIDIDSWVCQNTITINNY